MWPFESSSVADDPSLVQQQINKVKQMVAAWAADIKSLVKSPPPKNPALAKKREDLINRARTIKNRLESVFGKIDALEATGLGVLPLIGLAAIAALAWLLSSWGSDYAQYKKEVTQLNTLIANKTPPAQIAAIIKPKDLTAQGWGDTVKSYIPWIMGAGALYFFKDDIFRMLKHGRK